jgi:ABC-type branched-subunit amino acid transport system substrate-binding protein
VSEFLAALRRTGSRAQVLALSTVDAAAVVARVGAQVAHGLAIAQVVPSPLSSRTAIAREYRQHARELRPPGHALTQPGLEGYIAAKVLVEALRRTGGTPSPALLHRALEGLGPLDLGGVHVEFSPTRHSGTTYVDIAVVGSNGVLRH